MLLPGDQRPGPPVTSDNSGADRLALSGAEPPTASLRLTNVTAPHPAAAMVANDARRPAWCGGPRRSRQHCRGSPRESGAEFRLAVPSGDQQPVVTAPAGDGFGGGDRAAHVLVRAAVGGIQRTRRRAMHCRVPGAGDPQRHTRHDHRRIAGDGVAPAATSPAAASEAFAIPARAQYLRGRFVLMCG